MKNPSFIGHLFPALISVALLTGCSTATTSTSSPAQPPRQERLAPPGAPEGSCWHQNTSPAVVETVTEQVLVTDVQKNAEGEIITPAVFRTETRQEIVEPRRVSWIETPCPEALTPEFIASVQRALAARGFYNARITGYMDRTTRLALRRFQKASGLDSSTLSLATARHLGLIAVPRTDS